MCIQDVSLGIRNRATDGNRSAVRMHGDEVCGRKCGGFRGSVNIQQSRWRAVFQNARDGLRIGRVAAEQKMAQRLKCRRGMRSDLIKKRGGHEHRGDAFTTNCRREPCRLEHGIFRQDDDAPAIQERPPYFKRRGVERGIRCVTDRVFCGERGVVRIQDETRDGAMRHHDTFWCAGRTRGVNHIGLAAAIVPRRGSTELASPIQIHSQPAHSNLRSNFRRADHDRKRQILRHKVQPFGRP